MLVDGFGFGLSGRGRGRGCGMWDVEDLRRWVRPLGALAFVRTTYTTQVGSASGVKDWLSAALYTSADENTQYQKAYKSRKIQ